MDGGSSTEFQDWELLQGSDETGSVNSSESVESMKGFVGIEGDSEGMIRTDYFSLDSQSKYVKTVAEGDACEEGSMESDNPSWVDPGSELRYSRKEPGEFWPDSGSDRSEERKFSEFDAKNELGFVENEKSPVGSEGSKEFGHEDENLAKVWADSGGIGPISVEIADFDPETVISVGEKSDKVSAAGEEIPSRSQIADIGAVNSGGEEKKRGLVWWKLPLEFLKYCAFRVSPVWTFSVAAAVIGFVILRRRLYKMNAKSQSLQVKITMDDKKVSQFMSRAARLNEAFSIVKRVPVIRPSLPAAGVIQWPVMRV